MKYIENLNRETIFTFFNNSRPARYFVSGVTAFLIDTMIFNFLIFFVFEENLVVLLPNLSLPKLISGSIGIIFSFLFNRYWTFKDSKGNTFLYSVKMLISYIAAILVGAMLVTVFLDIFNSIEILEAVDFIFPTAANFLTAATLMVVNYFVYKYFVFK